MTASPATTASELYDLALAGLRSKAPDLADAISSLPPYFSGSYTVTTDGKAVSVNAPWFSALGTEERVAVLASLAFRPGSPLLRSRGDRDGFVWNLACSIVANANLSGRGFRLPHGAVIVPGCAGRTCDEVYDRIKDIPGLAPASRADLDRGRRSS
jgi:hypothetical protein